MIVNNRGDQLDFITVILFRRRAVGGHTVRSHLLVLDRRPERLIRVLVAVLVVRFRANGGLVMVAHSPVCCKVLRARRQLPRRVHRVCGHLL